MSQFPRNESKPLGLVWLDCPPTVVTAGLVQTLEERAVVHTGMAPPEDVSSCIVLCSNGQEGLSERLERHRKLSPEQPPILVLGSHLDLPLALNALRAGASGFVHAEMTPEQVLRAVAVAAKGELVAPRQLLQYLLTQDEPANLASLSARQRETLGYVVEGLSNAEIGKRLFLSESTIKQHLRSAYKILAVNNRTEAANLFRRSSKES
jgi:DNA-binding NarL/FixJ family response regulator